MGKFALIAERAAQICAALAAFIFLVSGLAYLCLGHWPVTHADYWVIYDFCLNHTWLETALLKRAGHSQFFPSFLWQANFLFFHGSQLPLFITGLALLFITAGLLLVPVWRDETVGPTTKIMATLVVIMGNFWMGRSVITASGGFNCENSLVMVGAALAFLLLPKMCAGWRQLRPPMLIAVCAGFVASFSMGIGLAIWPALLFLAWRLRLPRYSVVLLGLAGLMAVIVFVLLPPHDIELQGIRWSLPFAYTAFVWFCRLLGDPVSFAAFAWWPDKLFRHLIQSSGLALYAGMVGFVLATTVVPRIVRREPQRSTLEFTGLALIVFSLFAIALTVVGRADYFYAQGTADWPRYLFWSTLFWTGLLLIALKWADSRQWLRWPVYFVAVALPVLIFPMHYKNGLHCKWTRILAESGATSLVNGVRDDQQVRILAPVASGTNEVYHVAEELRARRLDMFADGLQDWLGLDETNLFGGRHKPEGLTGYCSVTALVQGDDGVQAARVIGEASTKINSIPKRLVIVDPTGVVRGVARSSTTSPIINRVFYSGKFTSNRFVGYIRGYDPQLQYAVRSADDGILSEERIPVRVQITKATKM
jgi:hypothetical protein